MYKEVLVPLSGGASDESVVAHAIAMAQLANAQVHLVQVLDSSVSGTRERPVDPVEWHLRKLEAEAYIDGVAERCRLCGVNTTEVLLEGQTSEHFINYAHHANTELIVMAGDQDGGTIGALGSELLWRSFATTLLVRSARAAQGASGEELHRPGDDDDPPSSDVNDPTGGEAGLEEYGEDEVEHASLHAALTPILVSRWPARRLAPTADRQLVGRAPARFRTEATTDLLLTPAGTTAVSPGYEPASSVHIVRTETSTALAGSRGGFIAASRTETSLAEVVLTEPELLPGAASSAARPVGRQQPTDEDSEQPIDVRFRRVLVALDGSRRSECVLPWVRLIAEKHGAKVVLAHVVADPELPRLMPASKEDVDLAQQLLERNRDEATAYLKDAQDRLGVESVTRLEVGTRVATKLHDIVAAEQIDLVVMSAHGYGGESRWPFGDVATNFIGYGRTTLLMVQDMPRRAEGWSRGDVTTERWGG